MADERRAPEPTKKSGKAFIVMIALMVLEAAGFGAWMVLNGPRQAQAQHVETPVPGDKPASGEVAEIKVMEFRAPNTKTGKMYLYDMEVAVECKKDKKEQVEALVKQREGAIRDTLSTIVRKADPQHLQEPDLETLRRQVHAALDEIFCPDMIDKVLIPRCVPYRAEY